jgi:4-carboxymuconolactone decarboxylase
LSATNEVLQDKGINLPLEGQSTSTPETRHAKGLSLQKAIFGAMIDRMYQQSPKPQLPMQEFPIGKLFWRLLHTARAGS